MLESEVETHLVQECELRGFFECKFKAPGCAGVPDRIVVGNGLTAFVELKRPGEKPRKLQKAIIARIRAAGGIACIADTKEKVDAVLNALEAGKRPDGN